LRGHEVGDAPGALETLIRFPAPTDSRPHDTGPRELESAAARRCPDFQQGTPL